MDERGSSNNFKLNRSCYLRGWQRHPGIFKPALGFLADQLSAYEVHGQADDIR